MVKKLFRYFISLSILLLSGYGQVFAHMYMGASISIMPRESIPCLSIPAAAQQTHIFTATSSNTRQATNAIEVAKNESEEEELFPLEISHFATLFYAHIAGSLYNQAKNGLHVSSCFSYFSSFGLLHIVFRTIRI